MTGAYGSYYGGLGVPGVIDDGDTAFEGDTRFQSGAVTFQGQPYITLACPRRSCTGRSRSRPGIAPTTARPSAALLNDGYGGSPGVVLVREASNALRAVIATRADPTASSVRTAPLDLAPAAGTTSR